VYGGNGAYSHQEPCQTVTITKDANRYICKYGMMRPAGEGTLIFDMNAASTFDLIMGSAGPSDCAENKNDAEEFSAPIKCKYADSVGYLDNGCPHDFSSTSEKAYTCDSVLYHGKYQLLCNGGNSIPANGKVDASVSYTSAGTGPVDVLSEGAVAACTDVDSGSTGIQYHDDIKKAFGITVSDNLRLHSGLGSHIRARKLRASHIMKMGAQRLRSHDSSVTKLYPVSDPYTGVNYRTQEDNERDCVHDGLNYCKFNNVGHDTHYGYCSSDCSNCKIDCKTCAIVTTCETYGGQAAVAATQVDPDCVPEYNDAYDSLAECLTGEGVANNDNGDCVITRTCVMTEGSDEVPGTKVDSSCVDGVGPYQTSTVAKNENNVVLGRYEDITCTESGGTVTCVVNCNNDDCEDLSAQPSGGYGRCVAPVGAASCQSQGSCGSGVPCTSDSECGGDLECSTSDNVCATPLSLGCKFHNKDSALAAENHGQGVEINELTVAQIKSEFIVCEYDGNSLSESQCEDASVNPAGADSLKIDTSQESTITADEQHCTCDGLEAAAKAQGNDQTIIDEMEARIQELKNLVDDGVYADICTPDEVGTCDNLNRAAGFLSGSLDEVINYAGLTESATYSRVTDNNGALTSYEWCKPTLKALVQECSDCFSNLDSADCAVDTYNIAPRLSDGQEDSSKEGSCKSVVYALYGISSESDTIDLGGSYGVQPWAAVKQILNGLLESTSHPAGTQGCKVYESNLGVEGAAITQIKQAKEALRLYLTDTAAGQSEIEALEATETARQSDVDAARLAALEVAHADLLDYYKGHDPIIVDGVITSPREEAWKVYQQTDVDGNVGDAENIDSHAEADEFIDMLHKVYSACQEAVALASTMASAQSSALLRKAEAEGYSVKDGDSADLDIDNCKTLSQAEFEAKKDYDDKYVQISTLETEIQGDGYVEAGDIVKHHRHYGCCVNSLDEFHDLERCETDSHCFGGGHCVAGLCISEPCLCTSTGYDTEAGSNPTNGDDFPISDADCQIGAFSSFCGDGICDAGETYSSCASDCKCGDGTCNSDFTGQFSEGEDCLNCNADCGASRTYGGVADNSACPADWHNDGQCGCKVESGVLKCEATQAHIDAGSVDANGNAFVAADDDCTCNALCTSNPSDMSLDTFGSNKYTQSTALSDRELVYVCARYGESGQNSCPDTSAEDSATAQNRGDFCLHVNNYYVRANAGTASGSSIILEDDNVDGNNVDERTDDQKHTYCLEVAQEFVANCKDIVVSGAASIPDVALTSIAVDTSKNSAGLTNKCISLRGLTGINTDLKIDSLKRWTHPPADCVDTGDIAQRTKVDSDCRDWTNKPGCPVSCSCPEAVQPVLKTDTVQHGDVIVNRVEEAECSFTCNHDCVAPPTGTLLTEDNYLDYCPSFTSSSLNTITVKLNGFDQSGSLDGTQDFSAVRIFSTVEVDGAFTFDTNPDQDCDAIDSADYTHINDYYAALGQCVTNNENRVREYTCGAADGSMNHNFVNGQMVFTPGNGGIVLPSDPCVYTALVREERASNKDADECYGLNGYDSTNDDTDSTAPGCRDANGALTGNPCFYGDGTDCHVDDVIYRSGTTTSEADSIETAGEGHTNGGTASGTHYGGNRQCDVDLGETPTSCAADCHCGDGTCGSYYDHTDTLREEDELECPEDCTYHCFDGATGSSTGCYEFHVRHFPVGNWNTEKGYDSSYSSFQDYCKSWPENSGTFNGGRGACPASGSRRRLLSFKSTLTDWASKFKAAVKKESDKVALELKRRKLLSVSEPVDEVLINDVELVNDDTSSSTKPRTDGTYKTFNDVGSTSSGTHIAWLNVGNTDYVTDIGTCLVQQRNTLKSALQEAITLVLGANGFDDEDNLASVSTPNAAIDATALEDVSSATYSSVSALNYLTSLAVKTVETEVDKQVTETGECSQAQRAIVHKFSSTWVPTAKCYPLKFLDSYHGPKDDGNGALATGSISVGFDTTELACRGIAGIIGSQHSSSGGPSVSDVQTMQPANKQMVRDSFMSLVHEFSYLSTVDKANIVDECSQEARKICGSASAITSKRPGGSCLDAGDRYQVSDGAGGYTEDLTFPAQQACLREYKNNLADIAKFISEPFQTNNMPFVSGHTADFHNAHLGSASFDTQTLQHRDKFANLRLLIGNKFASDGSDLLPVADTSEHNIDKGSIQACWEQYEQAVGYASDDAWVSVSGALGQAISQVQKVEQAIIAVHTEAKAECKLKCSLETERHQWSYLINACEYNDLPATGHNHEGPGTCECRRDSPAGSAYTADELADINKVRCHCRMGDHYTNFVDARSGGGYTEDCQVNPDDFITTDTTGKALVYPGRHTTVAVENALQAIISKSNSDINSFVDDIVTNLEGNLNAAAGGLLAQQGANTLTQVCHRIHNNVVSTQRQSLQLTDADAMDSFYANYLEQIQTGSLIDETATRRLSTEPCVLCD